MDESLSWRAKLAKANINILELHDRLIFVEFTYHPKPGIFKWCKTVFPFNDMMTLDNLAEAIIDEILTLRKELEG